jgi:phage tail-like protein
METPVRRKIKMPNLVGLQADTALLVLKNEGLTGGVIKYEESYETENLVISQSPGRGYILNTHDEIRVTVSQQSYAKYLPGIFQQPDIADSDFLKRFLFIFQHGFNAIESQITEMHQVFRPYDAPEKFLNWLAGWLALPLDDHWSEEKKRTLIKQAMNLYQVRGTVRGLKLFLKIFTDCEPTIIENA